MKKFIFIFGVLCLVQNNAIAKSEFSCGEKKYCKEMSSCAEAKFHLNQCGERRLDRDGDGIPCENVCRK